MNFNFQKQRENNMEICGNCCSIMPEDIQACHRLPTKSNNKTIVKFVNRKKNWLLEIENY